MSRSRILVILILSLSSLTCKPRKAKLAQASKSSEMAGLAIESDEVWKALGPFGSPLPLAKIGELSPHGVGRLICVNIHPKNRNEILAGHASSGLFKSTDGGLSWEQKLKFPFSSGVTSILRFEQNKQHILASTATDLGPSKQYGYGLIESFDGGETWVRNSLQFDPEEYKRDQCRDVALLDKKRENDLICISAHEIFISEDGAKSWKSVYKTDYHLKNIQVNPLNGKHIFVYGNALLESKDGGLSWTDLSVEINALCGQNYHTFTRLALCFSKKTKDRIFIINQNKQSYFLVADATQVLKAKVNNRQVGLMNISRLCLQVSYSEKENLETIWMGSTRLFSSQDEGLHFKQSTSPEYGVPNAAHDDINAIYTDFDDYVYIATDGGIDFSNDNGLNWKSVTNSSYNLNAGLCFGFDKSQTGLLLTGTQDNGVFICENGQWKNATFYGDGGRVVAINDSNGFACGLAQLNFFTYDGGRQFQLQHAGNERAGFDFRMQYVKKNESFYLANLHLYKKKSGKYFEILSSDLESDRLIKSFWVNPLNPKEIWLGKDDPTWGKELKNKLWYTRDEGITWEDRSTYLKVLMWRSISEIFVNPYGEIGIGIDGFDAKKGDLNKVFFSFDGGYTFENISAGLPNLPVTGLIYAAGRWICGTHNGVYVLQDKKWLPLGLGFPSSIVSELRYFQEDKILLVSTFGRGLWGIKLY